MTKAEFIETINFMYPNLPDQAVEIISDSYAKEYKDCCQEQAELVKDILDRVEDLPDISEFVRGKLFDLEDAHLRETSMIAESCYVLGGEDREKDLTKFVSSICKQLS